MRIDGHGHLFTLAQGNLHIKIKTRFSQTPLGYFEPNFVCNLSGTRRHDAGHVTAMSVHDLFNAKVKFGNLGFSI